MLWALARIQSCSLLRAVHDQVLCVYVCHAQPFTLMPRLLPQPGAAAGLPLDLAEALAALRAEQEALQTELEKR